MQFLGGLKGWIDSVPEDPAKWEFGGKKRTADGSFSDGDLVNLITTATKNAGGKYVRPVLENTDLGNFRSLRRSQCSSNHESNRDFRDSTWPRMEYRNIERSPSLFWSQTSCNFP
jgi:linoleate 10R-lipoxygenase